MTGATQTRPRPRRTACARCRPTRSRGHRSRWPPLRDKTGPQWTPGDRELAARAVRIPCLAKLVYNIFIHSQILTSSDCCWEINLYLFTCSYLLREEDKLTQGQNCAGQHCHNLGSAHHLKQKYKYQAQAQSPISALRLSLRLKFWIWLIHPTPTHQATFQALVKPLFGCGGQIKSGKCQVG